MANCHRDTLSSNQDDDAHHDHIGSMGSTPSGIATPQPDLSDKRLPGIMHNFFAQVRAGSDSTSIPRSSSIPSSAAPAREHRSSGVYKHPASKEPDLSSETQSLSESTVMLGRSQSSGGASHSSGLSYDTSDNEKSMASSTVNPFPTPPRSSFCSVLQKDAEEAENGAPAVETGVGSVYRSLKSLFLSKSSQKTSRHASYPVSGVSCDAAVASHLSNPTLPPPSLTPPTSSDPPISKSAEELVKLTENAVVGPRNKNTPPLTPRAMSNETQPVDKRPPRSIASSPSRNNREPSSRPSNDGSSIENTLSRQATSPESSSHGVPVAPVKGKLNVKILEGRGLRPSYDPYVVCVFEWNEYISKGAQSDEDPQNPDGNKKGRLDALGSAPIQRTNSDSGRPMAIPMNRQSSHNSMTDGNNHDGLSQVTDPQWNHDAVLCVT